MKIRPSQPRANVVINVTLCFLQRLFKPLLSPPVPPFHQSIVRNRSWRWQQLKQWQQMKEHQEENAMVGYSKRKTPFWQDPAKNRTHFNSKFFFKEFFTHQCDLIYLQKRKAVAKNIWDCATRTKNSKYLYSNWTPYPRRSPPLDGCNSSETLPPPSDSHLRTVCLAPQHRILSAVGCLRAFCLSRLIQVTLHGVDSAIPGLTRFPSGPKCEGVLSRNSFLFFFFFYHKRFYKISSSGLTLWLSLGSVTV